jgi:hypothetical protein
MGGHHSRVPQTVEWLTPWTSIADLGGADSFDLDPATPARQPWPTARSRFTEADDGLAHPWHGRIFLNPPYSTAAIWRWLQRLADHGTGTALIFARTETEAFCDQVWNRATALYFPRGRLNFHYPDGRDAAACMAGADHVWADREDDEHSHRRKAKPVWCVNCGLARKNSGAPSVFCAYGRDDADVLAQWSPGLGKFVPLILSRGVLVSALEPATWRQVVVEVMHRRGPIGLDELYRAMAEHPKVQGRRHWREKVRQVLQQGPFERVGPGVWAAAV